MSGFKQVHTKMWADNWFSDLTSEHKLQFIYLFSNDRVGLGGIYELPLKLAAFETGLSRETLLSGYEIFDEHDKVRYDKQFAVVWVLNLRKYHASNSPTQQTKIMKELAALPPSPLVDDYCEGYGIDRVSIRNIYKYRSTSSSKKDFSSLDHVEGELPPPLSDTAPDQMTAALATVTGLDPYIRDARRKLENVTVQLMGKYKPEQVLKRYGEDGEWYAQHWKGQKGQRPTTTDITTTIGMDRLSGNGGSKDKQQAGKPDNRKEKLARLIADEAEIDY
jgi:hypothetical protein